VNALAIVGVFLINFDASGNKLQISYVTFVRLLDIGKHQLLKFHCYLLGLVSFFIRHLGDSLAFAAYINAVLRRSDIPSKYLTIKTATNKNVGILRVELNDRNLDWCLQDIVERDNMRIAKV